MVRREHLKLPASSRTLLVQAVFAVGSQQFIEQRPQYGPLPPQSKEDKAQDQHQEEKTATDQSSTPCGGHLSQTGCGSQAWLPVSSFHSYGARNDYVLPL